MRLHHWGIPQGRGFRPVHPLAPSWVSGYQIFNFLTPSVSCWISTAIGASAKLPWCSTVQLYGDPLAGRS